MRNPLNRRYLILLALLVGLLPFSFSYAVLVTLEMPLHSAQMDHSPCAEQADPQHCTDVAKQGMPHEKCCSDHCDSSLGGQLYVAAEYGLQLPRGHYYQPHHSSWVSGPVPPTLLHPPQSAV